MLCNSVIGAYELLVLGYLGHKKTEQQEKNRLVTLSLNLRDFTPLVLIKSSPETHQNAVLVP